MLAAIRTVATGDALLSPSITRRVGNQLYISETTVKTHITHVLQKLNLRDRAQAVVLAYQSGIART